MVPVIERARAKIGRNNIMMAPKEEKAEDRHFENIEHAIGDYFSVDRWGSCAAWVFCVSSNSRDASAVLPRAL